MLEAPADFASIQARIDALLMLGVPYGSLIDRAEPVAREQARQIAEDIVAQGGPVGLEDKQVVALVAYLQRLGTDLMKAPPPTEPAVPPLAETGAPPTPAGPVLGSSGHQLVEEVSHAAQ